MLKAATPLLTFVVLLAAGLQKWSRSVFLAIALVSGGILVSVRADGQASLRGVLLMLGSCVCEASRMALVQLLQVVLVALVVLLRLMLLLEMDHVHLGVCFVSVLFVAWLSGCTVRCYMCWPST